MLQLNKDNLAQLWEAEVTTGCHVGGGMLILFVFQPDHVTNSVISAGKHSGLRPQTGLSQESLIYIRVNNVLLRRHRCNKQDSASIHQFFERLPHTHAARSD